MRPATLVLAATIAATALAGCGRKGALDPPGTVEAPEASMLPATVFGTSPAEPPAPAPPEPETKPFLLDFLI
jgi:predicted small lipoprotein YifL